MRFLVCLCLVHVICDVLPAVEGLTTVKPLLDKYCFDCHNAERKKGDIDLASHGDLATVLAYHHTWQAALELLRAGDMPPRKATQPSEDERRRLLGWIEAALAEGARQGAGDPGEVALARLGKQELIRTLRDLVGFVPTAAQNLPEDPAGGAGFNNDGKVLHLSPELFERYLAIAKEVADHATILAGSGVVVDPKRPLATLGPEELATWVTMRNVQFYERHAKPWMPSNKQLKMQAYIIACWQWHHRRQLGHQDLTVLAKTKSLDPAFLANWYRALTTDLPKNPFVDELRADFATMPAPQTADIPAVVTSTAAAMAAYNRSYMKFGYDQQHQSYHNKHSLRHEPGKEMHVVVTSAFSDHPADLVQVNISVQLQEGRRAPYIPLSQYLQTTQAAVAQSTAATALRARLGKTVSGVQAPADGFVLHAPVVVTLPIGPDVKTVRASFSLDKHHPQAGEASYQAALVAGPAPNPRRSLVGHHAHFMRLAGDRNAGKMSYVRPFKHMYRRILGYNEPSRLEHVLNNFKNSQARNFIYYLSTEQLAVRLPPSQAAQLPKLREDWVVASSEPLTKIQKLLSRIGSDADPLQVDVATLTGLNDQQRAWFRTTQAEARALPERRQATLAGHLRSFAARAWRRPLSDGEAEAVLAFHRQRLAEGDNAAAAEHRCIVRILTSPNFLYKIERSTDAARHRLSAGELASRLSYFLWGSAPDQQLAAAVADGSLLQDSVLVAQLRRMISDRRIRGLAEDFAGGWLGFKNFHEHKRIDTSRFPMFTPELRRLMREEAVRFFIHLVQQDRPIPEIVTADYTFLQPALAKHYGIRFKVDKRRPLAWRKTTVSRNHRGGVLGMGAILTATSYPLRTSPVTRGHWLLEVLLAEHMPPPPPDVPSLPADDKQAGPQTQRQMLEAHRRNPSCASCHDRIDPIGFALEQFDPVGRWRTKDMQGRPIDSRSQLADGTRIDGVAGLRRHLADQHHKLVRACVEKALGFALRRGLELSDRLLVDQITADLAKQENRFSALLEAIVLSDVFRSRRGRTSADGT